MKIDLDLCEGSCGEWSLEKFNVSELDAKSFNLRECVHRRRFISSGIYWKLVHRGETIMSNTPAEISDHQDFIMKANGNILVAGLGLGMVVKALLKKDNVLHITVVEKSSDVIKLVAPFYQDNRVSIINNDIFDYKPACKFDFAWFDIWTYISEDNYKEMVKLNRQFGRYVKMKEHWCYNQCRAMAKEVYD